MPLSRLYSIVSTSPLRTVTLWPTPCDTSVSAAVAPPRARHVEHAAATRSSAACRHGKMGRCRRRGTRRADVGRQWVKRWRRRSSIGVLVSGCGYHSKRHAATAAVGYHSNGPARPSRPFMPTHRPVPPPMSSPTSAPGDDRCRRRRRRSASTRCRRCRISASELVALDRSDSLARPARARSSMPITLARIDHAPRGEAPADAVHRPADARRRCRAVARHARAHGRRARSEERARFARARALARRAADRRRRPADVRRRPPGGAIVRALARLVARRARRTDARRPAAAPARALFRAICKAAIVGARTAPMRRTDADATLTTTRRDAAMTVDRPSCSIGLVSISDRASAGVYEDKGLPGCATWFRRR